MEQKLLKAFISIEQLTQIKRKNEKKTEVELKAQRKYQSDVCITHLILRTINKALSLHFFCVSRIEPRSHSFKACSLPLSYNFSFHFKHNDTNAPYKFSAFHMVKGKVKLILFLGFLCLKETWQIHFYSNVSSKCVVQWRQLSIKNLSGFYLYVYN